MRLLVGTSLRTSYPSPREAFPAPSGGGGLPLPPLGYGVFQLALGELLINRHLSASWFCPCLHIIIKSSDFPET